MGITTLIQRVQDTIKASIKKGGKNSFCSRSTSVTILGSRIPASVSITYTPCNGQPTTIPYRLLIDNGGYIPDCVIAGSPISVTSGGGDIFIPKTPNIDQGGAPINNTQTYQYFVQYGTTNCEVYPPVNFIFTPCSLGETIITSPPRFDFSFNQGSVYDITFGGAGQGCYTFNGFTSSEPFDSVVGINGEIGSCNQCKQG